MPVRRLLIPVTLLATVGAFLAVRALTAERAPDYAPGECTAWVYGKRPELTRGTDGLAAGDWEAWARANGFRVDTRPRAGDVAVWVRNIGAGPEGHVAFVESVTRDGAVFVSEQNMDGCRDAAFVRLTPSRLSTALFIHRITDRAARSRRRRLRRTREGRRLRRSARRWPWR